MSLNVAQVSITRAGIAGNQYSKLDYLETSPFSLKVCGWVIQNLTDLLEMKDTVCRRVNCS